MSDLGLIRAVQSGNYAEVQAMIQAGSDVNQQDTLGWTPLNFAAGMGELALVKLLVEAGADIFKTGKDLRTPYMIALAAGRAPVVAYLAELEEVYPGEKPARPERKYCKAYYLRDLRQYPDWSEGRINWKNPENVNADSEEFPDDKVLFIHHDFTVTESMWHDENVVFNRVDDSWKKFCRSLLNFKVPSDLDLIAQASRN